MVKLNQYGYYELSNKPNEKELKTYYQEKYYQESKGTYEQCYSDEDILYFENKIKEKVYLIEKFGLSKEKKSLLDIGCGEGWALNFFKKIGWEVTGVDYSDFGCAKFNPHCIENLMVGDMFEQLERLIQQNKKFDLVWLDNVLEHALDPNDLIKKSIQLLNKNALLLIEVPNDFSDLQKHLFENKFIDKEFWIAVPDHISYFNKSGLINLMHNNGFCALEVIGDYPIDINLLNEDSNYIKDKTKGKNCHRERIQFENFIHQQEMEKIIGFYRSMLDLGLGRQIIGLFALK
jgi:2-polyprenyl-3-methyl-5-hydroxy-6-metoxy-1,4-benzoquinol methylase